MTASFKPPSKNKHLLRWIEKMAELCNPKSIYWVDGSEEENSELCAQLVKSGTFIKLNEELWPGCYYARSTQPTWHASKTEHLSVHFPKTQPDRQTIGWIRLR